MKKKRPGTAGGERQELWGSEGKTGERDADSSGGEHWQPRGGAMKMNSPHPGKEALSASLRGLQEGGSGK